MKTPQLKITVKHVLTLEIDGKRVNGDFYIKGDWEGMVKLECDGPCNTVIINHPAKPPNVYDMLPKLLGGNLANGAQITVEADIVKLSPNLVPTPKP